jgi:hypothetical protein
MNCDFAPSATYTPSRKLVKMDQVLQPVVKGLPRSGPLRPGHFLGQSR